MNDLEFIHDLSPDGHLSPTASALFIYGLLPLLMLGAIGLAIYFSVRARRFARAAVEQSGRTIVRGSVEPDENSVPAVEISIVQVGREWRTKNGFTHRWTESSRSTRTRPFYLRTDDGKSLRVEPNDNVMLVDALDEISRSGTRRDLSAKLTPNEAAYVVGTLAQGADPRSASGYRMGATSWILRPPSNGSMLISTEPLADRFRRRASFHMRWAIGLTVTAIVCQAWFIPFIVRAVAGEVVQGQVSNMRTWVTVSHDRHGTHEHHHYGIWATVDASTTVNDEVSVDDYREIQQGETLPFIVVEGDDSFTQIGTSPSTHVGLLIGAIVSALIVIGIYAGRTASTRPWYMRKVVVHSGRGRLFESARLIDSR